MKKRCAGREAAQNRSLDLAEVIKSAVDQSLSQIGGRFAGTRRHTGSIRFTHRNTRQVTHKRFRKTWLRGTRCLEDLNNFWMAHKPQTMSELYSHLHEELELRLAEAERVGFGFDLPRGVVAPNAPKISSTKSQVEIAA